MQFKLLAALLFSATALAAPQATGTSSSTDESDLLDSIPSSILTVIETAIPATWWSDIMDPSSRDSIISEIEAGTMPAWYNSLPNSVKAWATSAYIGGNFADALLGASTTADTATGTAISVATATSSSGSAASTTSSAGSVTAAVSSSVSSASSAATSKAASAASAPSSAASSAHASATSTGGAPVATGGVAMSMVGAAGILGLALAL